VKGEKPKGLQHFTGKIFAVQKFLSILPIVRNFESKISVVRISNAQFEACKVQLGHGPSS